METKVDVRKMVCVCVWEDARSRGRARLTFRNRLHAFFHACYPFTESGMHHLGRGVRCLQSLMHSVFHLGRLEYLLKHAARAPILLGVVARARNRVRRCQYM